MRLTLDWDTDALKEMHLDAVRERIPAQDNQRRIAEFIEDTDAAAGDQWELWRSSSHGDGDTNGWHYVEYNESGNLERMRQLRTAYGDDKLRISLDGKRMEWGSPFVQVMYHMKQIKPGEHKPYSTPLRAELVERHGFDGEEQVETKAPDGTLNYGNIIEALADHADFGSRAALFRKVQSRPSVEKDQTDPSKRAYDLVKGRRSPTRNEAKALRDYAESREIGHYGDQEGTPEELADKPSRTTFHEYFEMPEVDFGTQQFGGADDDTESEWFPANIRTGTYDAVDEMTVKQVHDRIAERMVDILSPGSSVDGEYYGLDLDRWDRAISLERDRPLDGDEAARYRRIWFQNQPSTSEERIREKCERKGFDPFGDHAVHWETIVFDGENALKGNGSPSPWWIARGVLDASDPDAVQNPIRNSAIVADTQGWL